MSKSSSTTEDLLKGILDALESIRDDLKEMKKVQKETSEDQYEMSKDLQQAKDALNEMKCGQANVIEDLQQVKDALKEIKQGQVSMRENLGGINNTFQFYQDLISSSVSELADAHYDRNQQRKDGFDRSMNEGRQQRLATDGVRNPVPNPFKKKYVFQEEIRDLLRQIRDQSVPRPSSGC